MLFYAVLFSLVLEEIWECPGSDEPVIQIGPYTLTRNSLHYLKTTLSDEVIWKSLQ